MADEPTTDPPAPSLSDLASAIVAEQLKPENLEKLRKHEQNVALEKAKDHDQYAWETVKWFLQEATRVIIGATDFSEELLNPLAKGAIDSLLHGGEGGKRVDANSGDLLLQRLAGSSTTIEPGTRGAARYLSIFLNEQVEAWLRGVAVEVITEFMPKVAGIGGGVETVQHLQEIIEGALGGSRMIRRVLQPFISATAITPAQWHVNKTYRPELLSPADAIRQFLRGRWTDAKMREEIARQGFSDDRIDALINAQRKIFSPSDVRTFVERQHWTHDQGLQHLRDQGYDQDTATDVLRLEGLRIFESHEASEASAIITAYAARDIERGDFVGLLDTYIEVPTQRALYEELGELRRQLNIRHLSSAQTATAVRAGILAYPDYRRALAREGYTDEAVTVLELLLRHEIDEKTSIEKHRQQLEAERAREKALRDEAAAARKTEIERDRALKRRGPLSDLERAAVRGLIPFARVEEVLREDYDVDTVEILVSLMEEDRQKYLAQLAAADEARKRAARRNIDVGDLEAAVLANLIPIEEYQQRLQQLRFDPADAQLLAAVLQARKADQDAAKRKRDEAELAAKRRRIDLGRFERLVRLGARSMADYDALLADLQFDEPSRAAMRDLLNLEIAKDRQADEARAAAEARLRAKGLSLEQFRRAVVLGLKTVDQFNTFLVQQGFTADAVATLVADARLAVTDAAAARARRAATPARSEEPALPLSTIARAARLGLIPVDLYQARLREAGYSDDDIAIDMELLAVEIADVQARRARRDELAAETGERGLSLAQMEQAVKKGQAAVDDYRARAVSLNYGADDVELLVALLEDELGAAGG